MIRALLIPVDKIVQEHPGRQLQILQTSQDKRRIEKDKTKATVLDNS